MASAARKDEAAVEALEVRRNLAGQRLGRKGQETRERILAAALRLLEDPENPPVTLTSVAREATIRLTNLYLYFPDMTELLLAALVRVMDDADTAFMQSLRSRWPDDRLGEACHEFIRAHFRFWTKHARLLHLRNALSDTEPRVMAYRQNATRPILEFLAEQMDRRDAPYFTCSDLAVIVLTGFERVATVITNPNYYSFAGATESESRQAVIEKLIAAEARLLELAIRDQRGQAGAPDAGSANPR